MAELHSVSRTEFNSWRRSLHFPLQVLDKVLLLQNGDHAAHFRGAGHNGPATETSRKDGSILWNAKYANATSRRSTQKNKLVRSSVEDAISHFMGLSNWRFCSSPRMWFFSSAQHTSCPTSVRMLSVASSLILLQILFKFCVHPNFA